MDFVKKLFSAISLSILISLPISMLEALTIFSIIKLYEIPYLCNFEYYQILGISFIFMITRNRVKIYQEKEKEKNLLEQIIPLSLNRLFRVIFVWCVSFAVHFFIF